MSSVSSVNGGADAGSIRIESLCKSYEPGTMALAKATLDIPSGNFVALLGPSGSGKSTLLGLVAGFLTPDSGTIEIAGKDVRTVSPSERNLGVVFQDYALFPHLSVFDNVAFPLRARRWSRADAQTAVRAALELVGLVGMEQRRPAQLSGGQRQRVALARALVYQPPILLLDEPLAALDRRLRDAMQVELKRLHQQLGITFLFVTHDQEEALGMADTVVVMRDGAIEQVGSPLEIYERPATEFAARFIGDCNVFAGDVARDGSQLVVKRDGVVVFQGAADPSGDQACVAVRPEWITVVEPGSSVPAGWAEVEARVVQSRYRGSEVLLHCDSSLGQIDVRTTYGSAGPVIDGDRPALRLAWPADRGVVLNHQQPRREST
jgi:putative spermidine/putrescine transport system ATP-binding protein